MKNNELREYVDGIAADLRKAYEEDEEIGSLYDYLADALDVEYTISANGEFLGARIAVTLGGPNVWIDSREGLVKGYWGTEREEAWIPSEICDCINFQFEDLYRCLK
jgi:hypothetical protein